MIKTKQLKLTPLALALSVGLMAAAPAHADERESLETLRQTTLNLIEALVETGVLPREKADALIQAAREKAQAQAQAAADAAAAPTEATPAKRVLRVPYVPESVRAQIRDEVKEEIITQARAERWGVPGAPSWMNRIKIDGDIRVRTIEGMYGIFGHGNVAGIGQALALFVRWTGGIAAFGIGQHRRSPVRRAPEVGRYPGFSGACSPVLGTPGFCSPKCSLPSRWLSMSVCVPRCRVNR